MEQAKKLYDKVFDGLEELVENDPDKTGLYREILSDVTEMYAMLIRAQQNYEVELHINEGPLAPIEGVKT